MTISDENIGEYLDYALKLNGVKDLATSGNFQVGASPKTVQKQNIQLNADVVEYEFTVTDKVVNFPTTVRGKFITYNKPVLIIPDFKQDYLKGQQISLIGTVQHSKNVNIMYQFGENAKVEKLKQVISNNGQPVSFDGQINIHESFAERRLSYPLIVWVEDDNGVQAEKQKFEFYINKATPPTLTMAGLSMKRAKRGQQLIGFAAVNDDQPGRTIEILVQFGADAEFKKIPNGEGVFTHKTTEEEPFAFYWSVPIDAVPGKVYDVTFKAVDGTGLESDPIPKTLVVTN